MSRHVVEDNINDDAEKNVTYPLFKQDPMTKCCFLLNPCSVAPLHHRLKLPPVAASRLELVGDRLVAGPPAAALDVLVRRRHLVTDWTILWS